MARSAFGRKTAVFGVVVNVIGIVGAAAPVVTSNILGLCQFLAAPLIGVWFIVLSIKMYRHRSQFAGLDAATRSAWLTAAIPP